jgi:hypothetical protein
MSAFPDPEFLALVPVRAVPFETAEDGRVTLLRPKIISPRWAWLVRLLPRPNYRVRLDEKGSFLWTSLDGQASVGQLAARARACFGDEGEPHEERCALFLRELVRGNFVKWDGGGGS